MNAFLHTGAPRRAAALLLLVGLVLSALLVGCGHPEASTGRAQYHCPMHPTYVADEPGDCPICGMRLVPIEEKGEASRNGGASLPATVEPSPAAQDPQGRAIRFYRHPMNPEVTSPVPAKDEMGMDYVPVYADEAAATSNVAGMATVEANAAGVQLASVSTAVAARERIARETRTVGLVVPDERRVRHVHTKIEGWVEKLYVNFTGQYVRAGQPILSIYSPELLASQEELLRAREAASRFAGSSLPEVQRGGEDLVAAARRRLQLFDVPSSFITRLEQSGQTQRAVPLHAPTSGFVTAKDVFEGQEVAPGMELFTLTDLSHIWVEADFYEFEASLLRLGQHAVVQSPYLPAQALEGEVTFVYPTLDPNSRTIKVRLELANPKGDLKPGMYVDVLAHLESSEGIAVPDDAVIDTGARKVVFVERSAGVFEPREVRVGVRGDNKAILLSGVGEGEKVATRANFLLDSESRLRAAIAGMKVTPAPANGSAAPPPAATPAAGHQH